MYFSLQILPFFYSPVLFFSQKPFFYSFVFLFSTPNLGILLSSFIRNFVFSYYFYFFLSIGWLMTMWLKVVEISGMNQRKKFHRNCIFWWTSFFLVKPASHSSFIEQSPHRAGLCDKIITTLNSRIGLRNEVVNVDNHPHYSIVHYHLFGSTLSWL